MQEIDNNKIKENFPEEYQQHRKKMMRSYLQLGILVLFCTVFFWIGFNRGKISQNEDIPLQLQKTVFTNKEKSNNNTIDFSLFWKVWDLLKDKYVDVKSLDANNLYYGAIKGMMEATNDPYTTFFTAEENKRFNEDITGNFEGIGAELGIKNGILTIIAPLQGTPSEKAGLRSGDKIIKIDDKNSADMMIEEAVNSIRGPKGSSVKLTIFREGENDTRDVTVERDVINVKSVSIDWKENNIAYIEITRFGDDTLSGFASAILQVRTRKASGLIIDLRNNPGGYLDTSIDLASMLLPKGKIVVIEETRDKNQKNMYTSGGDMASGIETVVLINEGSASASEILAGALRDNRDNVTILGKKSFGKGSVQEFIELPQNNAVKITVGRWLTPKGVQINEHGIMPDKEVNLTNDDYNNNRDPQLEAAITTLKEKLNLK
ncbi:MAG TPA: S41 family peptidase [Candidatus Moranbacteria bacterium]|nr:S41 family peptidase [Candidatus Moranbacteria bacterium]HRZ33874.1 S41 family peptidase [Candidatus Moranbacteria bacterium]